MEFVKLLFSQSYEGYSYTNASNIEMTILGRFMTSDVRSRPSFYKEYALNILQQYTNSNSTALEKKMATYY